MKSLFIRIFLNNWQRKLVSLVLSMIIWMLINFSLVSEKTITNVPVKVSKIPQGKTIEGLVDNNGLINQTVTLTLIGKRKDINELTPSRIVVHVPAHKDCRQWLTNITKDNIFFLDDPNVSKKISKVTAQNIIIKYKELIKDKIPVHVIPIGHSPKNYQFMDVWPHTFYLSVEASKKQLEVLKKKGVQLKLNLSLITTQSLDNLHLQSNDSQNTEVIVDVPDSWKKVSLPELSPTPLLLDDPAAKYMRISFVKQNLINLQKDLPITIFYPQKHTQKINPKKYSLATNDFVYEKEGVYYLKGPLYAKGVSRFFLDTIDDTMTLVIIATPNKAPYLLWNVQFLYSGQKENQYVEKLLLQPYHANPENNIYSTEEFLRNRFRSYMNNFRLFTQNNQKLLLQMQLKDDKIHVFPMVSLDKLNKD